MLHQSKSVQKLHLRPVMSVFRQMTGISYFFVWWWQGTLLYWCARQGTLLYWVDQVCTVVVNIWICNEALLSWRETSILLAFIPNSSFKAEAQSGTARYSIQAKCITGHCFSFIPCNSRCDENAFRMAYKIVREGTAMEDDTQLFSCLLWN